MLRGLPRHHLNGAFNLGTISIQPDMIVTPFLSPPFVSFFLFVHSCGYLGLFSCLFVRSCGH